MNCSLSNRQIKNKIFLSPTVVVRLEIFLCSVAFFVESSLVFTLSLFFCMQESLREEAQGKSHLQESPFSGCRQSARHSAYHSGTTGTAKVSSKCKERKHGSSSFWNSCRRLTEASWPHNPNRKTADRAGSKT